jgi:hypothetical protein
VDPSGNLLVSTDPTSHSQRVRFCSRLTIAARQFVAQKLGARGGTENRRKTWTSR